MYFRLTGKVWHIGMRFLYKGNQSRLMNRPKRACIHNWRFSVTLNFLAMTKHRHIHTHTHKERERQTERERERESEWVSEWESESGRERERERLHGLVSSLSFDLGQSVLSRCSPNLKPISSLKAAGWMDGRCVVSNVYLNKYTKLK